MPVDTTFKNHPQGSLELFNINVVDLAKSRELRIVVNNKITDGHSEKDEVLEKDEGHARKHLIELTEKLAEGAKSGELLGLGGFAEYKDSYRFGLEGSYWLNPETAVLPLMRLHRRIMNQIEDEEEAEE